MAAMRATVRCWEEKLRLPTYLPAAPDLNPMFLEKRVYQGSSGRVYPLPFIDRVAEAPLEHEWRAVWIENEYLRVLILPELGGRIHALEDRTNGYDVIYRQATIKPALVGLAGPWISGGIEFNWPQHHRPATFMPVDFEVVRDPDGSVTVWCSDHDPMERMKGMHGVCLHPDRAYLELKVRAHNRTPLVQTFLWWANVATRVHEAYQSFFPPDVYYVADHAKRAMSEYPLCEGSYYGVDYRDRARRGVPLVDVPSQFVPPHCRPAARAPGPNQAPAAGLGSAGSDLGPPACELRGRGSDGQSPIPDHQSRIANHQSPIPHPSSPITNPRSLASEPPFYAPNDLSWYANIPTPCSYMCMGSSEDFFGGYDYRRQAGLVHVANHHVAPGKKQWTWGNHPFGYAWDRNLTDPDDRGEYGPYIELMAGVYTDNQPDFSFLHPGETKTWSQYWYPIQQIGTPQHANLDAAVRLDLTPSRVRVGVSVTRPFPQARLVLETARGVQLERTDLDLAPGRPFILEAAQPRRKLVVGDTVLRLFARDGRELIAFRPQPRVKGQVPPPATEPPAPAEVASSDELYLTGLHLEQYRHATRCPTLYWREALRRDPGDARCHNALGRWHLRRGEFTRAETHFREAIERLTRRNPNPYDGEPWYNLGLCLCHQQDAAPAEAGARSRIGDPPGRRTEAGVPDRNRVRPQQSSFLDQAYAAFYKATWNQPWAAAAYHALAQIDCRRHHWATALEHLDRSLRFDTDNLRARDLRAIVLRRLGRDAEAERFLRATLELDPLDWWTRHLLAQPLTCDLQTRLDLALDFARAGLDAEAIDLLRAPRADALERDPRNLGAVPLVHYYLGWLLERQGQPRRALAEYRQAAAAAPDYCFPARLEEIAILESARRANPQDPRAPYYLGNLLYDRRRHTEAIALFERSVALAPDFAVAWRNLGIGYFNIRQQPGRARAAYAKAFRARPTDARLLYESDQLRKRLGDSPASRLRALERHPDLVRRRDDLSVELCALYNQTGQPERALEVLEARQFQPWEGGEGQALGQHVRTHLALGRAALNRGDAACARGHFEQALASPANLGEAKHLLANQSDIHYWLGVACAQLGDRTSARRHWTAAADFQGDFQEMSVRSFSEMTYFSALAGERLGRKTRARRLLRDLLDHAKHLERAPARIEYFATSLPTMLLFEDDLEARQHTTARFLQAQAWLGLGQRARARTLLRRVLDRDPTHALAADLLAEVGNR